MYIFLRFFLYNFGLLHYTLVRIIITKSAIHSSFTHRPLFFRTIYISDRDDQNRSNRLSRARFYFTTITGACELHVTVSGDYVHRLSYVPSWHELHGEPFLFSKIFRRFFFPKLFITNIVYVHIVRT